MQVIMTTTQPGQANVTKRLPLEPAPIVTAVRTALPDIDASLPLSAVIEKAFTVENISYRYLSGDQRYQLRVKVDDNIMGITEIPTRTQVNLRLG